jgi:hypothetical protein
LKQLSNFLVVVSPSANYPSAGIAYPLRGFGVTNRGDCAFDPHEQVGYLVTGEAARGGRATHISLSSTRAGPRPGDPKADLFEVVPRVHGRAVAGHLLVDICDAGYGCTGGDVFSYVSWSAVTS